MANRITGFEDQISNIMTVDPLVFGKSLVIAPHPDDETLGCGGTAAILLREGFEVHFLFVSDGTLSHPNSIKYPVAALRALREKEAENAVKILGGTGVNVRFLAFPDRNVPNQESLYFEAAVRHFYNMIREIDPQSVFIPWQNDPHPDHRATYQIVTTAVSRLEKRPVLMQYPIWLWEMGNDRDVELISKMKLSCVDISSTLSIKLAALNAHESQVTDLIDDDPEGFRLSAEVIAHFKHSREIFFENINDSI